jgi:hypothetical protein
MMAMTRVGRLSCWTWGLLLKAMLLLLWQPVLLLQLGLDSSLSMQTALMVQNKQQQQQQAKQPRQFAFERHLQMLENTWKQPTA